MRVLVIDDAPAIREVIGGLLGDDYEIDGACDGIQAFLKAKSGNYDLALMDIRMPNFDGLEATQSIRALEKHQGKARMPIIGMSAEMDPKLERLCIGAGMDDCLAKPFDGNLLCFKVENYSRRHARVAC